MDKNLYLRTELVIGKSAIEKLKRSKVAIFGIGGVGGYAVEALARCGVSNLVLIDYDDIDITNLNRQVIALNSTVGKYKVDVMKERILDINPNANVTVYKKTYNSGNAHEILKNEYDYVIDAIDMVSSKIDLIKRCYENNINIISCMGMGNKLDPTQIRIGDLYKTTMCPLAKVMRKELKGVGVKNLKVVYSLEKPIKPTISIANESKREVPGSISFVPSVAGLIMAYAVVEDIIK